MIGFYETQNIGVKIKSPVELLVGLSKPFRIAYKDPKVLLYLQRKLNQTLFLPPNVAGWPGGKSWIDSSTLMLRLKLASVTLNDGVIEWNNNDDGTTAMMREKFYNKVKSKMQRKVKATPNWQLFLASLEKENKEELIDFIIQPELSNGAKMVVNKLDSKDTKNFIVELMSLPEYQLC